MFKVGDKVRCINATISSGCLGLNERTIYIVTRICGCQSHIYLNNKPDYQYHKANFVLEE